MSAPIPNNAPAPDPACDPAIDSAPGSDVNPDVNPSVAARFQLWLASPRGLRHFDPATLTASDRRRFDAMRNPQRRKEFAVSRALRAHAAVAASAVSLSHSGGRAALVCGPAGCAVGVDLEQHRPRDVASIAQFAFSRAESDALLALTSPQRERLFYSLWVMKEAMAKALQLPLLDALRSCVFHRQDGGWAGAVPTQRPWSLIAFEPGQRMSLAVACIGDDAAALPGLQIREWPSGYPANWEARSRVTTISSSTSTGERPGEPRPAFAAMRQNPGESSTCRT